MIVRGGLIRMSNKYSAEAIRKSYPAAYLIGWIEGEIEGLPQDMEPGCKDRFIEIHRAIISKLRSADEYERKYNELVEVVSARTGQAKLKAGEKLCEAAKAYHTMPLAHLRDALRKAIKDFEGAK